MNLPMMIVVKNVFVVVQHPHLEVLTSVVVATASLHHQKMVNLMK